MRKIKAIHLSQFRLLTEDTVGVIRDLGEAIGENSGEGALVSVLIILPGLSDLGFENRCFRCQFRRSGVLLLCEKTLRV
jgi:hypothetical protein